MHKEASLTRCLQIQDVRCFMTLRHPGCPLCMPHALHDSRCAPLPAAFDCNFMVPVDPGQFLICSLYFTVACHDMVVGL